MGKKDRNIRSECNSLESLGLRGKKYNLAYSILESLGLRGKGMEILIVILVQHEASRCDDAVEAGPVHLEVVLLPVLTRITSCTVNQEWSHLTGV